jgi:protein required for attachment to host cells
MRIPHNALVALANGEKFVVMRNTGLPLEPRLERIADLDLELTNFSAGVRHQDPAGQRNGSTDIDELAHGAAIAEWLNGRALQGDLDDVVI